VETNRVEAFSDGVFAIAITLLILAVGIDQARAKGPLEPELLHLWPAYIAYAVSFVTIGIMWVNHHLVFRQFARVDRPLLLLNVLLLMLIAFVPFPTRVVAQNAHTAGDREAAALLYGITLTATAILFFCVWIYGSRKLLRPDADRREVSGITRSYLPGAPVYAIATLIALVNPVASLIIFGALALFYAISSSFFGRDE
jgi:uncharacterized membrane protein